MCRFCTDVRKHFKLSFFTLKFRVSSVGHFSVSASLIYKVQRRNSGRRWDLLGLKTTLWLHRGLEQHWAFNNNIYWRSLGCHGFYKHTAELCLLVSTNDISMLQRTDPSLIQPLGLRNLLETVTEQNSSFTACRLWKLSASTHWTTDWKKDIIE